MPELFRLVNEPNFEYHELANQWPMMEKGEYAAFVESIKKAGKIKTPAVILDGKILDGRNRQRAAQELGLPLPVRDFDLNLDGTPEEFVVNMNDDRRHETQDTIIARREARVRLVLEKKKEGKSNRAIADEVGVSEKQVRKDLKKSVADWSAPEKSEPSNGKVKGKDGKNYNAKKTDKEKKAATEAAAAARAEREAAAEQDNPPEEVQSEELLDQNGQKLPVQAVPAFEFLPTLNGLIKELQNIRLRIGRLDKSPIAAHLHGTTVKTQITNAIKNLEGCRPAFVCPYCTGEDKKCDACHGDGWVTECQYEQRPEAQEVEACK
jgi:hypothetical protein